VSGTITSLYCNVALAPGATKTTTFQLSINGTLTGAACTISNTNKTSSVAQSVAITAGDVISTKYVTNGANTTAHWAATIGP
jgi:hypothetical protein